MASLSEQRLENNSYSASTPWSIGRDSRPLGASDQSLMDSRDDIGLAHGDLEPNVEESSHNLTGTIDNLASTTVKLAGTTVKLAGTTENIESTTDNLECVRDYPGGTTDSSGGIADGLNDTRAGRRDTMAFPTSSKQVLDELFQNVGRKSVGLSLDALREIALLDGSGAHTAGGIQGSHNTHTVSARNSSGTDGGQGK